MATTSKTSALAYAKQVAQSIPTKTEAPKNQTYCPDLNVPAQKPSRPYRPDLNTTTK